MTTTLPEIIPFDAITVGDEIRIDNTNPAGTTITITHMVIADVADGVVFDAHRLAYRWEKGDTITRVKRKRGPAHSARPLTLWTHPDHGLMICSPHARNDGLSFTGLDRPVGWIAGRSEQVDAVIDQLVPYVPSSNQDKSDRQSAWMEYRNEYGIGRNQIDAAHKGFTAGWEAARYGAQGGVLR